jgi:hypothetical protein
VEKLKKMGAKAKKSLPEKYYKELNKMKSTIKLKNDEKILGISLQSCAVGNQLFYLCISRYP